MLLVTAWTVRNNATPFHLSQRCVSKRLVRKATRGQSDRRAGPRGNIKRASGNGRESKYFHPASTCLPPLHRVLSRPDSRSLRFFPQNSLNASDDMDSNSTHTMFSYFPTEQPGPVLNYTRPEQGWVSIGLHPDVPQLLILHSSLLIGRPTTL